MDEQIVLLTSIRDILTRIERVLERIEANGNMAETPQPSAAPSVGPQPGAPKWRAR
jgi:gamma-glutamylcysteine synthetase